MKKLTTVCLFILLTAAIGSGAPLAEIDSALTDYFDGGDSTALSRAKTSVRKALFADPEDSGARVRLGIIISEYVKNSGNMDFTAEAESGLRMLNDDDITAEQDPEIRSRAWLGKAAIYSRLLMPGEADKYRNMAQEPNPQTIESPGPGTDISMPYYIDLGLKFEDKDSILLLPFTGIGLTKSAFSSMVSASAGVKYFFEGMDFNLEWVQGIVPDFSCFDYNYLESYGMASAGFSFYGNRLTVEVAAGRRLNSDESGSFFDLSSSAFMSFGIRESLTAELMLADDGLNKISAGISSGLKQLPGQNHNSWWITVSVPVSFDLVCAEVGFLPRFFHASNLAGSTVNIGKRHFIYENAVMLGGKEPSSKYFTFYETAAAIDGVIRLFASPLPAPADRLYFGLNGAAGFGYDSSSGRVDFLYYGGLSAGFDLNDNTPFEIRFGMDQDGYLFTYMTVVNRISHPF